MRSDDSEERPTVSKLKSYREDLQSVRELELFFLQCGKVGDKVSENAVIARSIQNTIDRCFTAVPTAD